jgi:hypothetical protein
MTITLEALSIILSIVALAITCVGFFASLKFYRDGMELQQSANAALAKIEEKTQAIQVQVGGMFEKTLDAAIHQNPDLIQAAERLREQLEKAKVESIAEAL